VNGDELHGLCDSKPFLRSLLGRRVLWELSSVWLDGLQEISTSNSQGGGANCCFRRNSSAGAGGARLKGGE